LTDGGTWFIGRLQAQRDKERVLQGLQGAIAEVGGQDTTFVSFLPWPFAILQV
jgi:hypothetical protein